jgi:hypothetical protein
MRYLIGFLLGVMFAASVAEHTDACTRAPRTPARTTPFLRRASS